MRKARLTRLRVAGAAVCAAVAAACGASAQKSEVRKDAPGVKRQVTEVKKDVPYVPTPQNVVDEMLRLANVTNDDVVYDLGCGDGRLVITAVKNFGAKHGVGVDIDPQRIEERTMASFVATVFALRFSLIRRWSR